MGDCGRLTARGLRPFNGLRAKSVGVFRLLLFLVPFACALSLIPILARLGPTAVKFLDITGQNGFCAAPASWSFVIPSPDF